MNVNESCTHKVATHVHGTHACYVLDRCRCTDCTTARREYEQKRKQWTGPYPRILPPRVDAAPVRDHVHSLMEQGMGLKRIGKIAGVAHGAVSKLVYGDYLRGSPPSKTVTRINATKLLAVQLDLADGAQVDATEARLLIAELVARGWCKAEIGRRVHGPHAYALQAARGRKVFAGTLRTLRRLQDEPVPERRHPRGSTYPVHTDHKWTRIPATTPGIPAPLLDDTTWLRIMREGLRTALDATYRRDQ